MNMVKILGWLLVSATLLAALIILQIAGMAFMEGLADRRVRQRKALIRKSVHSEERPLSDDLLIYRKGTNDSLRS
jgi:hypothetical protein